MPGENRFLIIGIDEYPNTRYKKLSNAKIDGTRLAKVLQERYNVVPVQSPLNDVDATCDAIRDAILELASTSYEEDSLIIYYAGHGAQNEHSKKGYWIPVDGEFDQKKYIKNSTVIDDLENIQAKHILLISDSCFSGTFITQTRSSGKTLNHDELDAKKSRWIFVSGGETPVQDGRPGEGSPFGIALCNFLEKNTAPTISAGDLFDEVIRVVENKGGQEPAAAVMHSAFHDGGQMIFRLKNNKGSYSEQIPFEPIRFPLPDKTVEYYIPRLLTYYDYQESKAYKFYQTDVGIIYLNTLIKTEKHIVILGTAGSGKSVELLSQAYTLQNSQEGLNPIFKRFNTYTEENIADYLPEGWEKADPATLVLFLDGLDEIQPKYFQTAIRKITSFAEQHPLIKMVISCRNNFYELPYKNFSGTLDGFSVYTLNDISVPEVQNYVTDHFSLDGLEFVEKVYYHSFLDLVQKPFFLNILIRYYKDFGDFKAGRAGIMEEALLRYYTNDKNHFLSTITPLTKTQIFSYLEKVAFVMEILGKNFLSEEELLDIFKTSEEKERYNYLPAFGKVGDEDKWMFEHNNLQEYIASRVLNRKNAEDIINIISVITAGEKRVKPSWVNTLSFYISISSDTEVSSTILNWIISHDREVLVKFEPERLNKAQRVSLFKDIFNFYTDKQVWINSNNFSYKDLARFGESKETINFLLPLLEEQSDNRIAKLNALHVLSNLQITYFSDAQDRIRQALTGLLDDKSLSSNDIYSVIGAIADLKLGDHATVVQIIGKYKERRNQYIRAALYKLLLLSKLVDEYIEVFLAGIDLAELDSPTEDRESVNLFDETFYLKLALEDIVSAEAVEKVIDKLASSRNKREVLLHDHPQIMASLMKTATSQYSGSESLFNLILKYYLIESSEFRPKAIEPIIQFFEDTNTKWRAFLSIWQDTQLSDYDKNSAIKLLFDSSIVNEFITYLKTSVNQENEIKQFHELLFWYKRSDKEGLLLIDLYEKSVQKFFGIELVRPIFLDWEQIRKQQDQQSFDLWFDNEQMLNSIRKLYIEIGKDDFTRDELYKFNYSDSPQGKINNAVSQVFNHLTMRGRIVTQLEVENYISYSEDYQHFKISKIHADIKNKKDLELSIAQEAYIQNWCLSVGDNQEILWDFMINFNIQLPDEKILELTNFTNFNYDVKLMEPGSIEKLEKFISKSKLKDRVLENLKDDDLHMLAWTSNAGYALRHNFNIAYADILKKLFKKVNYEYKFAEILKLWFSKTQDTSKLKEFIDNVEVDYLKWVSVKLLEETGKEVEYLKDLFHKIITSEEDNAEDKILAANHLMRLDDLYGFYYISNIILSNPDPNFGFRHGLGSVFMLKSPEAIGTLIQLLQIAKRPEYKRDVFNDMEEKLLDAFYNIGIQSNENYTAVKTALERFIQDFEGKLPHVNFLYYTIQKIEDQLKRKYITNYTINDALKEYNVISNS